MTYKKGLQIMALVLVISSTTFAQPLNYTDKFQFLGYHESDPVFELYEPDAHPKGLYKIRSEDTDLYGFYIYDTLDFLTKEVEFIYDEFLLRRHKKDGEFQNILYYGNGSEEIKNWAIEHCVYSKTQEKAIIFLSNEYDYLSVEVSFGHPEPEVVYIPIKGDRGYLKDDWLYFSFFHENYDYSPHPHDIFRVKLGDWLNPQLVFEGSEYDEWFLYPESNVIGTDISLDMLEREENRESEILYNVETKSYAVVPNISQDVIQVDGKYYVYFEKTDNTRGIRTIGLALLPELPTIYPYTGHDVLPREVWYNFPLSEKTFDGTFITPHVLRVASVSDLEQLDKSQLRLLRNALYAQYGYLFSTADLKDFFNQFEWYRMITKRKKSNDDFVILKEDEERAETIRAIESRKN